MTRLCKQPPASMKSDLLHSSLNPSAVDAQYMCDVLLNSFSLLPETPGGLKTKKKV